MGFKVGDKVLVDDCRGIDTLDRLGEIEAVDSGDPEYPYLVRISIWCSEADIKKVNITVKKVSE
jgi:hypothetical protein